MTDDGHDIDQFENSLREALGCPPPAGSADRVRDKVWSRVPLLAGQPVRSGVAAGDSAPPAEEIRRSWRRIAAVVGIAAALMVVMGVGAAFASQGAQPGDAPYSTKRLVENAKVSAATSDASEADARLAIADRRLDEAATAAGGGKFGTAEDLVNEYDNQIQKVDEKAESDEQVAEKLDNAVKKHDDKLKSLEDKFKELEAQAPEAARKGLARAAEVHARNAARRAAHAKAKGKSDSEANNQGQGNDQGKSNGKGQGNDQGKSNAQGEGDSQAGDQGNGQGKGQGGDQGNGNGQGNDQGGNSAGGGSLDPVP